MTPPRVLPRAPLLLLALLLVLLLMPLPSAAADHVYSHRYVMEGRLLGSDGTPLPGREVGFFAEGMHLRERCLEPPGNVTDENGDFRFCFHAHELNASAQVGVRVGNVTAARPIDTAFRKTVVILREPNETGVAPEGWNETHLVVGRAWRHGPQEMEGVRVYGNTVNGATVNVTLRTPSGGESAFQVTTDGHGDFRIPLRLVEDVAPENVTLVVEVLGEREERHLEPFSHRVTLGIILPAEGIDPDSPRPFEVDFPPQGARQPAPGQTVPRISPGLVLLVAAGLAGAVWLARRSSP